MKYLNKAILKLVIVVLGATMLTFGLIFFVPGNPAEIILSQSGSEPTKEEIIQLEKKMGLDKPVHIQYIRWIKNVVKGDLGVSYVNREPVISEIVYRIPATLKLTVISFILMICISFPIGIICAIYKNSIADNIIKGITFLFMSMPSFWLGFILIYYFSIRLKILPVVGNETIKHIILPSAVLAIPMACKYIRLVRIVFIEKLEAEYVISLRAKGLKTKIIILNNVLKNAMITLIPSISISFGSLLGGSVIVENIFAWPGLGNYLVSSIMNRDFPVIQAYVLIMGIVFVLINFCADIISNILNPQVLLQGR